MEIIIYPIIIVVFAIWQIFPLVGFWIYAIVLSIYLLFTIPPMFTARKYFEPVKDRILERLTHEEYDFLKKHALYYMYPFGARTFSGIASMLQLLGIVFGIVFLIRKYWFYGFISLLNYPMFAFIAPMLNKPFFLTEAMRNNSNNPYIIREVQLSQRVAKFIEHEWRDVIEKVKLERQKKDATYED